MTGAAQDHFVVAHADWFRNPAAAGYATPYRGPDWSDGGGNLADRIAIFQKLARAGAPRHLLYFVALDHAAVTIAKWTSANRSVTICRAF